MSRRPGPTSACSSAGLPIARPGSRDRRPSAAPPCHRHRRRRGRPPLSLAHSNSRARLRPVRALCDPRICAEVRVATGGGPSRILSPAEAMDAICGHRRGSGPPAPCRAARVSQHAARARGAPRRARPALFWISTRAACAGACVRPRLILSFVRRAGGACGDRGLSRRRHPERCRPAPLSWQRSTRARGAEHHRGNSPHFSPTSFSISGTGAAATTR